jgi:hypothetical protein
LAQPTPRGDAGDLQDVNPVTSRRAGRVPDVLTDARDLNHKRMQVWVRFGFSDGRFDPIRVRVEVGGQLNASDDRSRPWLIVVTSGNV